MKVRWLIVPILVIATGYFTRGYWLPKVPPKPTDAHEGHDHGAAAADRVKLSPEAQANLKLDVDTLEPQPFWKTMLIPGIVVDRPGESDRTVPARLAGVVNAILAKPGDTVKAAEPLITLHIVSEFALSTQAELAKASQELRLATAKRDRTAGLVKLGTTPESALVEDEANVKRFTGQVRTYRRQLQTFGFDAAQIDKADAGEPITEVTVTAPGDSGTVFEMQDLKVQLGDSVTAGQALATLANHQKLFVEGHAFKSEAAALSEAAKEKVPIVAEFADEPPGSWPALSPLTIHHLSNQVDPQSRTFAFFLPLENQSKSFERDGRTFYTWRYRPGQRVRLKVPIEKLGDEVLVLPAGAVVREGAEAYAFIQNGDLFVRKPVRVLYEDRTNVVLANDGSISPAMFVARNQAAALNRAIKANAGGGGGGHEGHDHSH